MKILNTEIPDEVFNQLVDDIFGNFPEYSDGGVMTCVRWKYDLREFSFVDEEDENKRYNLTKTEMEKGTRLFLEMKLKGELPGVFQDIPEDEYTDGAHYDAYASQAVVQLACFGEVRYG